MSPIPIVKYPVLHLRKTLSEYLYEDFLDPLISELSGSFGGPQEGTEKKERKLKATY